MKNKTKKRKTDLKIKEMKYTRLWNTGNYENEKLEAVISIGPKDTPAVEYKKLREWVNKTMRSEIRDSEW